MSAPRSRPSRFSPPLLGALLLLALLESMGTLRADLFPNLLSDLPSPVDRQILALGLFASVSALVTLLNRAEWPRGTVLRSSILIGIGLFAAPALLVTATQGWLPATTRAALFSLAPVFAVVFSPYLGPDSSDGSRPPESKTLLAAMLTVIGTLLVFPVVIPASLPSVIAFLATIGTTACIAVTSCHASRITRRWSPSIQKPTRLYPAIWFRAAPLAAIAAFAGFLGLSLLRLVTARTPSIHTLTPSITESTLFWSAGIEVPALLILFGLMPRLSATRMTTRFPLSLFLSITIGAALLRTALSLRTCIGLAAMVAGVAYLQFAPEEVASDPTRPLS